MCDSTMMRAQPHAPPNSRSDGGGGVENNALLGGRRFGDDDEAGDSLSPLQAHHKLKRVVHTGDGTAMSPWMCHCHFLLLVLRIWCGTPVISCSNASMQGSGGLLDRRRMLHCRLNHVNACKQQPAQLWQANGQAARLVPARTCQRC